MEFSSVFCRILLCGFHKKDCRIFVYYCYHVYMVFLYTVRKYGIFTIFVWEFPKIVKF